MAALRDETGLPELQTCESARVEHGGTSEDLLIDALHLAELIAPVRAQFALPASVTDAVVLQDLELIARHSDVRARWRAAFGSSLARDLGRRGCDLNTTIGALLALLPKPTQ